MLPTISTGNVASALAGEYEVANSLRFDDASSDNLSRTFSGSSTSNRILTISCWFKKVENGISQYIFDGGNSSGNENPISFNTDDEFLFGQYNGSSDDFALATDAKCRDLSAWYHLVAAIDTTQSTQSNRLKMYINGIQQSLHGGTQVPQNLDLFTLGASTKYFGRPVWTSSSRRLNGYLAEFYLIDGQQLTPTSFGEFDSDSPNIWKPIEYEGTFGNYGFYLDFENASSLGADVSGNSNNFTVNNLTSIDQTTDTCTNNFATLNPLDFTGSITSSEGNTVFQGGRYKATFGVSSGKWYWEAKRLNAPDNAYVGIKADDGDWNNSYNNSYTYYTSNGNYYLNGSSQGSYGSSSTTNDILIFALDMDNGKFYVGENGTFYNSGDPASGTNPMASSISGTYLPVVINNSASGTDQYSFNFGNPSFTISSGNADANGHGNFEYAPPSGFFALCTKNLAEFG